MDNFLSVDFESRSTVDLRKTGVYPYAVDPTTSLWCMAYALGKGEVQLWLPGFPVPGEIQYALDEGMDFRAWNAQFERVMWACIGVIDHGFPRVPRECWVDTAAEAAAMSLPRGLGKAAQVLGTGHQKDDGGHRLMLQMAKPRTRDPLTWWDQPEKVARLADYCQQDVETERAIAYKLRRLSESETATYQLDQQANDRGVRIDVPLVKALKALADEAVARANARLVEISEGAIEAVTNPQNVLRWLRGTGLPLEDLTKQTVAEALDGDLTPEQREVLQIRADAGKTSVKKLEAMLQWAGPDDRARGMLLYHGAGTGRWAGKGIQPQNFPRPTVEDPERYIPQVLEGDYDGIEEAVGVMELVPSLLRSCLVAGEGSRFLCADFSAIEGHVTAWLAGQDTGMLSYEQMAGAIFGMDPENVEKDSMERQVGKVAVLGCGFGMGWKKYQETVKAWTGLDIDDDLAHEAVDVYRMENGRIKRLWNDLQSAATDAVRHPGKVVMCGRNGSVKYVVRGKFLWCVLPSGRPLAYANPTIEDRMAPWGDMTQSVMVWTVDSMTKKWVQRSLYGGLQTENVVQATARDLMANSMRRVQAAGYNVVLTVHDEVLVETPNDNGSLSEFNALMSERPNWCQNMPLQVEGWEGQRYRK